MMTEDDFFVCVNTILVSIVLTWVILGSFWDILPLRVTAAVKRYVHALAIHCKAAYLF